MNKKTGSKIPKVALIPAAFAPLARAINDLIDQADQSASAIKTSPPLRLTQGNDGRAILEIDIAKLREALASDPKSRAGGGAGGNLESRVADLENRLSGFGPRGVFVCITGTLTTVTFLTK
jgi:hypothetical protein